MKKKLWKCSFIVVALITVMIGFAGCSEKKEEKKETISSQDIQEEYRYQSSFQNISTKADYITNACIRDDIIYMSGSKWIENEEDKKNEKECIYLIHCAMDGSNLKQTELKGLQEKESPTVLMIDDKNQLRLLTQKYEYNEKTKKSKSEYYIHTLNENGKVIESIELKKGKKQSEDDYFYPEAGRTIFYNGKIYIATGNKIYCFDEKGEKEKIYEIKEGRYIESFVLTSNQKTYLYGNIGDEYGLREFDLETEKVGECIDFGNYRISNVQKIRAGKGDKIYINDGNSLYMVDISTSEIKEEINWLNNDINGDNLIDYFPLEDDKFFTIGSSYDENEKQEMTEFAAINKRKVSEIKEREIINLFCIYLDYDVKSQVLSFNKTNKDYRIEVKNYDIYENGEEKMNMDIAAGNIPDILDVSMGVSKEQLIKKGMFVDLYSFMEKDSEVKKEDFIPSVLKAMESDEKLYCLPPSFSIQAFIGGKKMVGNQEEWSVDDMITMYENKEKDSVFIYSMTRQNFIRNIMIHQMEDYINYSTNEVRFDSDYFIKLIEFCKNFPEEEELYSTEQESMPTLVQKGKLLLNTLYLSSIEDIEMYTKLYKKQGGYTILGYPSEEKSGKVSISFDKGALAILAQSEKQKGAWEFLRQFFTYSYQKNPNRYGLPVRQDAFEKKMEYAQATKAYIDKDGTKVEPKNMAYGFDGYTITIGAASKKETEVVSSLLTRIGTCASYGAALEAVCDIINEEIKAFFAGDKSAKEVAEIIQNRVSIYVSENS